MPRVINTDEAGCYTAVIRKLKEEVSYLKGQSSDK
jgi:hypothetical protein